MNILGISAFYHDSSASLLVDGVIVAAAQEERFTRIKHDPKFPINAIKFCLEHANLDISDIDSIIYYEKPFLKFERLLATLYFCAPRGLMLYLRSMPIWIKQKLFLKKIIKDEIESLGVSIDKKTKILFSEHHLSHAASAFYPSNFEKAAIVTLDGVGEWATASIYSGDDKDIIIHKELKYPHSIGLLYSAFTYFLGFKVNSGEYKLMGLAPYGDPDNIETQSMKVKIENHLVKIKDDGSIQLNIKYFEFLSGLKMIKKKNGKNSLVFLIEILLMKLNNIIVI